MSLPVIQYRKAIPADFEGILHLQHQNLITTLRAEDLSHGFLTIEFTSEQLHKINSELGICVAIQGEKVVGYLMAESIAFAVGSPLIAHLLNRLKEIVFDDVPLSTRRLFVYGPVCIDREHRCLRSGTGEKIEIDWQVGNSWLVWSKCSSRQKRIPWVLSL